MAEEITHLEEVPHLLQRPDTIVGSVTPEEVSMHVFRPKPVRETKKFVPISESFDVAWNRIAVAPALISVVMEIVTNALDRQFVDPTLSKIDVWVDCEEAGGPGWIRVRNDGSGIPVVMDEAQQMWKPHMAFGLFRTGSNFQDSAGPRYTGGRNGYGCKATNAFSTHMRIHTGCAVHHKQFRQEYQNNMSVVGEPSVSAYRSKRGFTDVSFHLDYARFGVAVSENGGIDVLTKAAIEAAIIDSSACTLKKTKMTLNGTPLGVRSLADFASMFTAEDKRAYDCVKNGDMVMWEVCAVPLLRGAEETKFGFVNSLRCSEGTHMNMAYSKIAEVVETMIKKQYRKTIAVTPRMVKQHLFLCVRAMVDSPSFDSQTKNKLNTPHRRFGFQWAPSPKFVRTIGETGVVQRIYERVNSREESKASSSTRSSRVVNVNKYEGAVNARRANSDCTLFVTEGDSAKSLVMAGLSVVGREDFGVFPLKGKLLNVQNCGVDRIMKNDEIVNLMKIMGLEYGKIYDSLSQLRYKRLVIFSDQDPDGSHIAGLLMNFMHALFPSVIALQPTFIKRFVTPIVRCTHKRTKEEKAFFSLPAFREWEQTVDMSQYKSKYYKGLGTSTAAQGKQYFREYDDHMVNLRWTGEGSNEMMEKFFAQTDSGGDKASAARRDLIDNFYNPEAYVDYSMDEVTYEQFLQDEVLDFGNYSNSRAIPSAIDGFKPSQRKAIWTLQSNKVNSDIKVSEATGMVSLKMGYGHGEVSMVEVIVKMAQEHANNVSYFVPSGMFGSRNTPRGVHAAARYISTRNMPIARALFPASDDKVLTFVNHEGTLVEPEYMVSPIATALLNGSEGIGWGWRTSVPAYNPEDLIAASRRWIDGGDEAVSQGPPLQPWRADFEGTVELEDGEYKSRGVYRVEGSTIYITELPFDTWTAAYVDRIKPRYMIGSTYGDGKYPQFIKILDNLSTFSRVHLILHCDPAMLATVRDQLESLLFLRKAIPTNQMYMFDARGRMRKFDTPEAVVCEHARVRLALYTKRKEYQLTEMRKELLILRNKHRFVSEVDEVLVVRGRSVEEIVAEMDTQGYDRVNGDFDYLLDMSFKSRTSARLQKLENQIASLEMEIQTLEGLTERDLWRADLDNLESALVTYYEERVARFAEEDGDGAGKRALQGGKAKAGKRRRVA